LFGKTVVAVATGDENSVTLCSDGTVAAWGWNAYGQVGDNTTTDSHVPVAVNTTSGTSALAGQVVCLLGGNGGADSEHVLALASITVVTSVAVPAAGTYKGGDSLDFTVNFADVVTVNTTGGTPAIGLTVGATPRNASYLSGSGTTALVFRYTVPGGDLDTDGIAVASAISLNGGTIQGAIGNDATLALNSVASTTGVLVDGVAPTAALAYSPSGPYKSGAAVTITATLD
jgi:hypothetical protein